MRSPVWLFYLGMVLIIAGAFLLNGPWGWRGIAGGALLVVLGLASLHVFVDRDSRRGW